MLNVGIQDKQTKIRPILFFNNLLHSEEERAKDDYCNNQSDKIT